LLHILNSGAPTINYIGNQTFRALVRTRKTEYADAVRHQTKNEIARQIVDEIASRGGRFLRGIDDPTEARELGVPQGAKAWKIVKLSVAMEKAKQALRDKDPISSFPAAVMPTSSLGVPLFASSAPWPNNLSVGQSSSTGAALDTSAVNPAILAYLLQQDQNRVAAEWQEQQRQQLALLLQQQMQQQQHQQRPAQTLSLQNFLQMQRQEQTTLGAQLQIQPSSLAISQQAGRASDNIVNPSQQQLQLAALLNNNRFAPPAAAATSNATGGSLNDLLATHQAALPMTAQQQQRPVSAPAANGGSTPQLGAGSMVNDSVLLSLILQHQRQSQLPVAMAASAVASRAPAELNSPSSGSDNSSGKKIRATDNAVEQDEKQQEENDDSSSSSSEELKPSGRPPKRLKPSSE